MKKVLSLVLIMALVFCLCSCGEKKNEPQETEVNDIVEIEEEDSINTYLGDLPLFFGNTIEEVSEFFNEDYEKYNAKGGEWISFSDGFDFFYPEDGVIDTLEMVYSTKSFKLDEGLTTTSTYNEVYNYLKNKGKSVKPVFINLEDSCYCCEFDVNEYTVVYEYDSSDSLEFDMNANADRVIIYESINDSLNLSTSYVGEWVAPTFYDNYPIEMNLEISDINSSFLDCVFSVNRIFYEENLHISLNNGVGEFNLSNEVYTLTGSIDVNKGCIVLGINQSDSVEIPEGEYCFCFGDSLY